MSTETKADGLVAHIENRKRVVINLGSDQDVREGDRYLIYDIGPEIKDPQTGKALGKLEIVKGKGTVVHVQKAIAIVETEGQAVKIKTRKIPSPYASIGKLLSGEIEVVEEEFPPEEFYDVKIGDNARLLD